MEGGTEGHGDANMRIGEHSSDTGEISVGQKNRKQRFIFRFYLKTTSGRNKIHRLSENWVHI
jgi:glycosidase